MTQYVHKPTVVDAFQSVPGVDAPQLTERTPELRYTIDKLYYYPFCFNRSRNARRVSADCWLSVATYPTQQAAEQAYPLSLEGIAGVAGFLLAGGKEHFRILLPFSYTRYKEHEQRDPVEPQSDLWLDYATYMQYVEKLPQGRRFLFSEDHREQPQPITVPEFSWVLTHPNGSCEVLSDEQFQATYEKVIASEGQAISAEPATGGEPA